MIADFDANLLTGSTVSSWTPKRGTEMSAATLVAGGVAPSIISSSTPSGLPAVRWKRDELGGLRTTAWANHTVPMTLVWVSMHGDPANNGNFAPSSGDGTGPYAYLAYNPGGETVDVGFNGKQFSEAPIPVGEWMITVLTGNTTETTLTTVTTSTPNPTRRIGPAAPSATVMSGITLGTNGSTNIRGLGYVARHALLNRVLTEGEVSDLIASLRTQYGI